MDYRFYLVDRAGRFRAAEAFSAADDTAAAEIASCVYAECSDVFAGYELWRGTDCLVVKRNSSGASAPPCLPEIVAARQQSVADLEERLQRTFACMRESRRLLEATARWRAR